MNRRKKGFTLIEAIISLAIFSAAIALASQLTARGMKSPFVRERAEPWLTFMEEVNLKIQSLPHDDPLLDYEERNNPFPQLSSSLGIKKFKLRWANCNLAKYRPEETKASLVCAPGRQSGEPKIKAAFLSGLTRQGAKISWRAYKKLSSENSD